MARRRSHLPGPRRILFVVDEWSACAWYRCNVPGSELQKHGHQIALLDNAPPQMVAEADVVVFLRHFTPQAAEAMRAAKRLGKLVVYDIDDALWEITPDNPAYRIYSSAEVKRGMTACIQAADIVTTTTQPLARLLKGRHPNVLVLPNMLPAEAWPFDAPKEQRDEQVVIGWAGGHSHYQDLSTIGSAVTDVLDAHPNAVFLYTGLAEVPFPAHERIVPIQGAPIDQYAHLLRNFDIGIAAVQGTKFNRCKSDLKALEYSMVGIPVVATDIETYNGFVKDGETGFLVKTETDWREALTKLVEDRELRSRLGRNAQEAARARLIAANIGLWQEAYGFDLVSAPQPPVTRSYTASLPVLSPVEGGRSADDVSIVVLTHNKLDLTRQCFERIAETTSGYELVVVDNASSDGTVEYLRELEASDPRVTVVYNEENTGFAHGCNQGVAVASNELVCLLNNDTLPYPGWLDAMRAALGEDVGAVGAKLLFPDRTLQHAGVYFRLVPGPQPRFIPDHRMLRMPEHVPEANVLEEVPGVTAACLLTTRTVWDSVGGMDEGYVMANFEDVDFNLKVRDAGFKVIYQPAAQLTHFEHGTSDAMRGENDPRQYFQQNLERLNDRWRARLLAGLAEVGAAGEAGGKHA